MFKKTFKIEFITHSVLQLLEGMHNYTFSSATHLRQLPIQGSSSKPKKLKNFADHLGFGGLMTVAQNYVTKKNAHLEFAVKMPGISKNIFSQMVVKNGDFTIGSNP